MPTKPTDAVGEGSKSASVRAAATHIQPDVIHESPPATCGATAAIGRGQQETPEKAALKPGRAAQTAPLKTLNHEELALAVAELEAVKRDWKAKGNKSIKTFLSINRHKANWNTRVRDVSVTLNFVKPNATNVAYMFQGQPVGLLSASHPVDSKGRPTPYVEIHALVSHPGTEGVGGALVEHAVNLAQDGGADGVVRLSTLRGAKRAYEAMGFKAVGMGIMELDPAVSDKWTRSDEGLWRLAKHADKKYIGGFNASGNR